MTKKEFPNILWYKHASIYINIIIDNRQILMHIYNNSNIQIVICFILLRPFDFMGVLRCTFREMSSAFRLFIVWLWE